MLDMAVDSFLSGVHIMVLDPKLLTRLLYDGSYLGIV